jgi:Histidine kinase-, DNA gyrase B-, and HSP90-like ATPase
MSERRHARTPWVVWGGAIVLLVPTVVLALRNGNFSDDAYYTLAAMTMIVGYSTVGAVIASRNPRSPIGWLLMTVGVGFLFGGFSAEYLEYAYLTRPGSLPVGPGFALAANAFWLPTFVAPLTVDVDADGVGRYPPEVEAAVYFCILEAMSNAAKYSAGAAAHVRLASEDGNLSFEVVDEGIGFDPASTGYGTGLQGMADRLDAIGGRLTVESAPEAGTTVRGRIPVRGIA